jgi:hypothetical protein
MVYMFFNTLILVHDIDQILFMQFDPHIKIIYYFNSSQGIKVEVFFLFWFERERPLMFGNLA